MKQVQVIYGDSMEDEVMEVLDKLGIKYFTKMVGLTGHGSHADPHLNTSVWPGLNQCLMLLLDEAAKDKLWPLLKELKTKYHRIGMKVIVSPVEEII